MVWLCNVLEQVLWKEDIVSLRAYQLIRQNLNVDKNSIYISPSQNQVAQYPLLFDWSVKRGWLSVALQAVLVLRINLLRIELNCCSLLAPEANPQQAVHLISILSPQTAIPLKIISHTAYCWYSAEIYRY